MRHMQPLRRVRGGGYLSHDWRALGVKLYTATAEVDGWRTGM